MTHPLTVNHTANSATENISEAHGKIIQSKPLLNKFYTREYQFFLREISSIVPGPILEIGSGGGFFQNFVPNLILSDITPVPDVSVVCNAERLPFLDHTLSAIVMMNVLHHIPDCSNFFEEANRVLKSGGKIIMLEPAYTPFSKIIYKSLHNEPFDEYSLEWKFKAKSIYDRLMDANVALPWAVFIRDRKRFEALYPRLKIQRITPESPLLYLLSGGLSFMQLVPTRLMPLIAPLETVLSPLNRFWGLFYRIVLQKD
jgi:SAM-dependent methyltransferase